MVSFESGIINTPIWAYLITAIFGFWAYYRFESKILASVLTIIIFLGVISGQWVAIVLIGLILMITQGLPKINLIPNAAKKSGITTPDDMIKDRQEAMQIVRDAQTEEYNSQIMKSLYKGHGWIDMY